MFAWIMRASTVRRRSTCTSTVKHRVAFVDESACICRARAVVVIPAERGLALTCCDVFHSVAWALGISFSASLVTSLSFAWASSLSLRVSLRLSSTPPLLCIRRIRRHAWGEDLDVAIDKVVSLLLCFLFVCFFVFATTKRPPSIYPLVMSM